MNYKKIKEFVLNLMNIEQFDLIIKRKEKEGFEKGRIDKLNEIKNIFNIR